MTINHDSNHISNQPKEKNSFWKSFFRLLLVILIGVVLAILLYIGFTQYYRQLINTIDSNQQSIKDIDKRLGQLEIQADERLPEYNRRLSILESDKSLNAEKLSEIEADIESAEKLLDEQADEIKKQTKFNEQLDDLSTSVASLLTQTPIPTEEAVQPDLLTLSHNLQMLRSAELLNRSRIYLLQNNYGLAIQDIEKARNILLNLQPEAMQNETLLLNMEIDKLNNALDLLPGNPSLASADIEATWDMLVVGLTENTISIPMNFTYNTPTATPTTTLSPSVDETISPESDEEVLKATPTMEATPKIGATPTR